MDEWLHLLRVNINKLDSELQEIIYNSFHKFAYKNIYFLILDHSTTEDIIHESFLKLITHGTRMKHDTNIKGWIRQVTRNTTLDWIRKDRVRRHYFNKAIIDSTEETLSVYEVDIASKVEKKFRNKLLYQSIAELKPEYRHLLVLRYLEEKSFKEIREVLHLSEQIIAQRLVRARKKLFQKFSRKWMESDEGDFDLQLP